MLFNSFAFFAFFGLLFCGYIRLNHKKQNRLLLVASYFFYGAWDYRFLALLLTTTTIDYFTGLILFRTKNRKSRKACLMLSIFINLTILGLFKYFNFFTDSLVDFWVALGFEVSPVSLKFILPVGISFYTFQSMSYTIDLYRREIKPISNFLDYALYVSFFPQLVAGPIERARHLLPQIKSPRFLTFAGFQSGCYYIFWGLFLKVFMADNLARLVNPVFADPQSQTGFSYLLAGYGFAFQIYGDFAGYSNIAKGLGAILGFDIMDNFNLPYFAKNPQEFWHRWHISLSTWLRDYLYIPLGGNRNSTLKTIRNLLITMLLGGLWHGAKFTFIVWGMFHGLLLIFYYLVSHKYGKVVRANFRNQVTNVLKIVIFFHIIVISWYFFRAESMQQVAQIFHSFIYNFDFSPVRHSEFIIKLLFYILPLFVIQLLQYSTDNIQVISEMPVMVKTFVYVVIFYLISIFGVNHAQDFIYFQF